MKRFRGIIFLLVNCLTMTACSSAARVADVYEEINKTDEQHFYEYRCENYKGDPHSAPEPVIQSPISCDDVRHPGQSNEDYQKYKQFREDITKRKDQ